MATPGSTPDPAMVAPPSPKPLPANPPPRPQRQRGRDFQLFALFVVLLSAMLWAADHLKPGWNWVGAAAALTLARTPGG